MRTTAWLKLGALILLSALLGWAADAWEPALYPPWWRANALSRAGGHVQAHQEYLRHVALGERSPALLEDLLSNHGRWVLRRGPPTTGEPESPAAAHRLNPMPLGPVMLAFDVPGAAPDAQLWRLLVRMGPRQMPFSYEEWEHLTALADARVPTPWANRVMARRAWLEGEPGLAATRYLREGLLVAEHHEDVGHALTLWLDLGAWEPLEQSLAASSVSSLAPPYVRYRLAVHQRDWALASAWFLPAFFGGMAPLPLLLAGVTGLLWLLFCMRLGHARHASRRRVPLYLVSLVLGALSVAPTLVLITLQENVLHLRESGDPAKDALYFLMGVGFREELCKLLLCLPLLPVVLRARNRLEVLTCGALVGLGFAAEENVLYLGHGELTTALGRFLTANLFHMALTSRCFAALYDAVRDPGRRSFDASVAFLEVVLLHAAYDYFIVHQTLGGGMQLAPLVLATRHFMGAVGETRDSRRDARDLREFFLLCVGAVSGATFVYASFHVGVVVAGLALSSGALGLGLMAFLFVREMGHL